MAGTGGLMPSSPSASLLAWGLHGIRAMVDEIEGGPRSSNPLAAWSPVLRPQLSCSIRSSSAEVSTLELGCTRRPAAPERNTLGWPVFHLQSSQPGTECILDALEPSQNIGSHISERLSAQVIPLKADTWPDKQAAGRRTSSNERSP